MRLTLDQLNVLSDAELAKRWCRDKFPFDRMMNCSLCLTVHISGCRSHAQVVAQMNALADREKLYSCSFGTERGQILHKNLDELYALRMFYDSLYRPEPAEPVTPREVMDATLAAREARLEREIAATEAQ